MTNQPRVYGKCSNYVKQREKGWKELESRHQSIRESVYVCVLEGVAKYTSVCVIWCKGRKNVRELPRVERGGLHRHRLQSDVLLTVNSVQPDKHTKGSNPDSKGCRHTKRSRQNSFIIFKQLFKNNGKNISELIELIKDINLTELGRNKEDEIMQNISKKKLLATYLTE